MRMILGFLMAGLLAVAPARAAQQFTTGVIQGIVTDTTGDSIPGVTVEARHVETNQARTVVSGDDGRYNLLQLPPGTYRVTFSLPGFASHVQENVVLTVGQSITLPIAMKVAGVAETVTVRTSPRVIESTVRVTLPEGFQRAEFLQTKGAVDFICDRRELRKTVAHALAMLQRQPADAVS